MKAVVNTNRKNKKIIQFVPFIFGAVGVSLNYGSGSTKMMRHLAVPTQAPQHCNKP
jgi:hypothetical protein